MRTVARSLRLQKAVNALFWTWMLGGWITFFFMLTPWEPMRGVGFIGFTLLFISWLSMMDDEG